MDEGALVVKEEEEEEIQDQSILSPEIMENILSHLDLPRLKFCRLICKSWNQEVGRLLRKKEVVSLTLAPASKSSTSSQYYTPKWPSFFSLLTSGRKLKLPIPFQRIRLEAQIHETGQILEQLQEFSVSVTVLKLFEDSKNSVAANQRHVLALIKHSAPTLTRLDMGRLYFPRLLTSGVSFPLLETFRYTTAHKSDPEDAELFSMIVDSSPNLKHVLCQSHEFCQRIFFRSKLGLIQRLTIESLDEKLFLALKKLEIPQLKALSLKFLPWDGDTTAGALELISKFSSSLEELTLTSVDLVFPQFESNFPLCPELKLLQIPKFFLGSSLLEKVPFLQHLSVHSINTNLKTEDIIPNCNVTTVRVQHFGSVGSATVWSRRPPAELLLLQLRNQFPKATTWEVDSRVLKTFSEVMDQNGAESSGQVKELGLHLKGRLNQDMSLVFSGLKKLKELTTLKLLVSERGEATDIVTRIKFTEIPALKNLEFHWVDFMDVAAVIKNLRFCERIVVSNCCTPKYSRQMEVLFMGLPQMFCGCKS